MDHGGGAAKPSGGVDLMNRCVTRGAGVLAHIFLMPPSKDFNRFTKLMYAF